MSLELKTQEQFAAFTEEVARELGTHCRTTPCLSHMLSRIIIDDEGRVLSLRQHDFEHPTRLKVYAALPDDSQVRNPRIGVTASSAQHVAREITRRLYPLHAEASRRAVELTTRADAEVRDRRAVTEAVVRALPGARVEENYRVTKVVWQRPCQPDGDGSPVRHDTARVTVGPSGESVRVEVSGRPAGIAAMLAAFAEQ
jgi:hypothetical protein